MMPALELNLDSLVGPTHNYAGLAHGNLASQRYASAPSNPRAAALEGLSKMRLLMDLGLRQAVLPPHDRPDLGALRRLGFAGSDAAILEAAHCTDPALLASCYSSSAMWAANAATVSASADAQDARVHFTPANLISQFHRSLETPTTAAILEAIFPEGEHFTHHAPLPAASQFADEGAANHTRLARSYDQPGLELFVYGRRALDPASVHPSKYPARQTCEASESIARLHRLDPAATLFVQQNPEAIDAGVFHNDVIAVGNRNVLLCHERAFLDRGATLAALRSAYAARCNGDLVIIEATDAHFSLDEAVRTYLFNSQLVTLLDGRMCLIAPHECAESEAARRFIDETIASASNPIASVHYVDVRQSMRNGGGPACLRLRVPLTGAELAAMHPGVLLTPSLHATLTAWIHRHYRDHLTPDDLRDPKLLDESRRALEELTTLLKLPRIYDVQPARAARSPGRGE